jgi:hypothetical protein
MGPTIDRREHADAIKAAEAGLVALQWGPPLTGGNTTVYGGKNGDTWVLRWGPPLTGGNTIEPVARTLGGDILQWGPAIDRRGTRLRGYGPRDLC